MSVGYPVMENERKHKLPIEAKASIAYLFGNILSKGMSILTLPLFVRMLTTAEIGVNSTYQAWYTIIYTVVSLSLCSGSLSVAMMDYSKKRDQYESACLTLSSLSAALFFLLIFLLRDSLSEITTLDTELLIFIAINMLFCPALDFWYTRQRYEYKYKQSVAMSCSITILSTLFALICVYYCSTHNFNSLGNVRVISQGVITLLFAVGVYLYIMLKGKSFVNIEIWKYAIILSTPLILHSLAKNLLDISDRIMISSLCGKSEAGVYGTIYSLATVITVIWSAINSAIIPSSFKFLNEKNYKELNAMYIPLLFAFGGVAVIVSLLAPEVLLVFTTKEYFDAVGLVPPIVAGVYFTALYTMYGNFLLYKKKTVHVMYATLLAAAINITLNYICIKLFGYYAAAYTTLVSFIVLAIFQGIMTKIVYKETIVNDIAFFALSTVVSVLCLMSAFLYRFFWLRYIIVVGIIVLCIIKREMLYKVLKRS